MSEEFLRFFTDKIMYTLDAEDSSKVYKSKALEKLGIKIPFDRLNDVSTWKGSYIDLPAGDGIHRIIGFNRGTLNSEHAFGSKFKMAFLVTKDDYKKFNLMDMIDRMCHNRKFIDSYLKHPRETLDLKMDFVWTTHAWDKISKSVLDDFDNLRVNVNPSSGMYKYFARDYDIFIKTADEDIKAVIPTKPYVEQLEKEAKAKAEMIARNEKEIMERKASRTLRGRITLLMNKAKDSFKAFSDKNPKIGSFLKMKSGKWYNLGLAMSALTAAYSYYDLKVSSDMSDLITREDAFMESYRSRVDFLVKNGAPVEELKRLEGIRDMYFSRNNSAKIIKVSERADGYMDRFRSYVSDLMDKGSEITGSSKAFIISGYGAGILMMILGVMLYSRTVGDDKSLIDSVIKEFTDAFSSIGNNGNPASIMDYLYAPVKAVISVIQRSPLGSLMFILGLSIVMFMTMGIVLSWNTLFKETGALNR